MERKTRRIKGSSFEERMLSTLEAQDRLLERVEQKLESPVLNGGFDNLMRKVDRIETIQEQLQASDSASGKKIDQLHTAIFDPEIGLYSKVKSNSNWISRTTKGFQWLGGIVVVGILSGLGKMMYDFLTGHVHFIP